MPFCDVPQLFRHGVSSYASDEHVRRQLLDLEQQWQHVAKTYEFVASLERFLLDQQNHTLPREVEKLPKDAPELGET
jgi:hypothetical protein